MTRSSFNTTSAGVASLFTPLGQLQHLEIQVMITASADAVGWQSHVNTRAADCLTGMETMKRRNQATSRVESVMPTPRDELAV